LALSQTLSRVAKEINVKDKPQLDLKDEQSIFYLDLDVSNEGSEVQKLNALLAR